MQAEVTPPFPLNHVFVDLENVKSIDATVLGGNNLKLHLFLGPQNKKLDVEVVEKLLENAQAVQMIRTGKVGKNALDFVLAYHLGQAVLTDPRGFFHIVSKDAGYDALVELLKSRHVKVRRHEDWSGLHFQSPPKPAQTVAPVPAVSNAQASSKVPITPVLSSEATKLVENLKKLTKPKRPKKKESLTAHAKSIFGKATSDASVAKVMDELKKAKLISINENDAVTYLL